MVDALDVVVSILDNMLQSPRKRHIVGGILLSVSALFSGLAITAMTLKPEENDEQYN